MTAFTPTTQLDWSGPGHWSPCPRRCVHCHARTRTRDAPNTRRGISSCAGGGATSRWPGSRH